MLPVTSKLTNKETPLKTSTSLHYDTLVGKNSVIKTTKIEIGEKWKTGCLAAVRNMASLGPCIFRVDV